MKLFADLLVGLLKLMLLGLGLFLILGGGFCVLLPLGSPASNSLGLAGIGAVMLLVGVGGWWAIIRSFMGKGKDEAPVAPEGAEASGERPEIDRPWERR